MRSFGGAENGSIRGGYLISARCEVKYSPGLSKIPVTESAMKGLAVQERNFRRGTWGNNALLRYHHM
jgi:hypothetical protein